MMNNKTQIDKPLVCVRSITYNHAPYIEDTMNGFCMQKTSFPFVCAVIDDCSTDGEQEVISNYLHEHFDLEDQSVVRNEETDDYKLIYARHKENHNCFFVVLYLKYNHYSIGKDSRKNEYIKEWYDSAKYIALCEGDDYWIHPHKLQKQVDYLESHPECGLVYTNSRIFNQSAGTFSDVTFPKQSDFKGLLVESVIFTLTTCFKRELYVRYLQEIQVNPKWLMGDTPLWLFIAAQGPIKYLPDVTSVYRVLENSASHSNDMNKTIRFCLSSYDIRIYFAKKYHCENLIKQITVHHINELFKIAVSFDKSVSFLVAKMAWRNFVFSPLIWLKTILYATSCGRELHRWRYTN